MKQHVAVRTIAPTITACQLGGLMTRTIAIQVARAMLVLFALGSLLGVQGPEPADDCGISVPGAHSVAPAAPAENDTPPPPFLGEDQTVAPLDSHTTALATSRTHQSAHERAILGFAPKRPPPHVVAAHF